MNAAVHRFVRLGETQRREIRIWIDGRPTQALEGDTLLVALLSNAGHLCHSEFSSARPRCEASSGAASTFAALIKFETLRCRHLSQQQ